MEILNNIWCAFSTENARLVTVILIPFTFLEAYIAFLLFTTFLKIEYTKFQKYVYVLTASIIGIITMHSLHAPLNTLVNYILLFFIIRKLFNLPLFKTILAMIMPFFTFSIFGILILNPIIKAFSVELSLLDTVPLYRIIYLCILYILILIIIYLFKLKATKVYFLDDLDRHNKNIVMINLLLGIFTLVIQLIITTFYIDAFPVYITFLSSISLFFYFVISVYSLNHIMKLQKTTIELENAENYNKTLSILYDNVKGFKHDFDNMLNMIGGFIQNDDMDGLKQYYLELESDYEKVKNIATLNPNLINNPGIYNLLATKYKKANELGIKINLEYFFDFEKLHMPVYQFSRMLGILLDNAIEAASSSSEKELNIRFRDSTNNHTQIIIIENTYSNKEIDISKIFEKGVTEKNGHMGMGLWEVKQIIMNNNNINLTPTADGKYFKQQLEIYY